MVSLMLVMIPAVSSAAESKVSSINKVKVVDSRGTTEFTSSDSLAQCGTVSYKEKLVINNRIQELYPIFDDSESAIEKISKEQKNLLSKISLKYQMKCFDETTWEDYYNVLPQYEEYVKMQYTDTDKNEVLYKQIPHLYEFFDIYENESANDKIIQEVRKTAISSKENIYQIKESDFDTINSLLPQISTIKDAPPVAKANTAFNKSAAIEYAKGWATSYNPQYPKYSHDCTNFASQIKKAGGIKMSSASSGNVKKGWWYLKTTRASSNSWRIATNFARYFGRSTYTGSSFKTFSNKITAGRFIGYNRTKDGDVDHIGFVTAKNSKLKTTEGITYYNFKVAQHTSNYNLWVSSKDNGWDALHKKYPKISYTIIG